MHLRLSIVFEKFLKEKNKSKKDRSFAPSTFRLSAEPSLFSSARRRASVPPRKAAPFPKERGAAPPPAKIPLDLPFSRVRPCQTAGARNRKKSAAALSRPPFVPPLLWERFFSPSRGNRQKGRRFTPFVENFSCVSNRGRPDLPLKSCMCGFPAAHEIFIGSLRF